MTKPSQVARSVRSAALILAAGFALASLLAGCASKIAGTSPSPRKSAPTSASTSSSTTGFSSDYRFDKIIFFEAGKTAPEEKKDRIASTRFNKATARYIYTQFEVTNNRYRGREHSHNMVFKYYNPNGSLRGNAGATFTIKPEWQTSWIFRGWGWENPGNWPAGKYRVEVWVDGRKVTQSYFEIYEQIAQAKPKYTMPALPVPKPASKPAFPTPKRVGNSSRSDLAQWEIINQTDYAVTITYTQGIDKSTVTVQPNSSRDIWVEGGHYEVEGISGKPNVKPYGGTVDLKAGWKYRNTFFIKTINE